MKKIIYSVIFFVVCVYLANFSAGFVFAQSDSERLEQLNRQIQEYQNQIVKLQSQANTLSNQIAQFDAQIRLTELKINQTQEQVLLLGGRIDELEASLSSLSSAFSTRAIETYKMSRISQQVVLLVTASDLTKAMARFHYLKQIQEADRSLMLRLQSAQNTYKNQKDQLEKLQEQLSAQKQELDGQKKAKANLLAVTKNDEKKYQQLLSASRAELEAIQAIIAGRGDETEAGHVNEGARIASVISGASCNSSGGHLHFIVSEQGQVKNPFSYLKSGIDSENCSGSSCGSSDGDSFSPSGSWNWPIQPKVKFNQGYGVTWAVKNTWAGKVYNFHNGIDITSNSSNDVKAVQGGNLFRGSYSGTNGCRLRYVRVDHDNSSLDTFYLHVNY